MRLIGFTAVSGGEAEEGSGPGRGGVEDEARGFRDVGEAEGGLGAVAPAQPPDAVEGGGCCGNQPALPPLTGIGQPLGGRAGHEGHAERREAEGKDQQDRRRDIPPAVVAIECDQRGQTEGQRPEVADLEGPEQVLEGRPQKEDQGDPDQRRPVPDPSPHPDEEQRADRQEHDQRSKLERPV